MSIDALNQVLTTQQTQTPPRGKGPAALAKALGISEDKLKQMSPKDVEKLAKEKGVDLKQYGRPNQPLQSRDDNSLNSSVFKKH